jgi:hypothetical protein
VSVSASAMLRLDCYRVEHSKTLLTTFCQQGFAVLRTSKGEIQGSFASLRMTTV